ncbi:PREDICTED: uncharacterized protein LOC105452799 isoform X2 [Wasmannia auropunctata]|nr:PREDICTED: uncharacterized protein LOC105452799 isoform X2 [Wasmannia auropunctata]XP_011692550.1 PREDICTED: uncharacterized protein LOC105452799 isoform X2 [Wasmannia auropunctata]XP_011692558.1 PREDICTED: uncharacterized protein LOC105452799 isoform X2 [Wasmannia auropunctata]
MRLEEDLVIRRSRPTMISAKYRAREERRRLLKISAGKLRRIEDPEASLCRSVLINNAVRRLQRENRDEKTRSYGTLPVVASYMDASKENNIAENLIADVTDEETSSRKRLADDSRNDGLNSKRHRHDDLDLQDDVFSDFYILPPTPRLLSHIDEIQSEAVASHHNDNRHLDFSEDRLSSGVADVRPNGTIISTSSTSTNGNGVDSTTSCHSMLFPGVGDLDDTSVQLSRPGTDMMEVADVVDPDRLCDFSRFADSAKTLEERLAELQSLDEHFDLTKFERNNNQSCGRAFHDIQTFHSLVPGLET